MVSLKRAGVVLSAVVMVLPVAADQTLTLPLADVEMMRETFVRKCPGTVVSVSRVDIVPQVSGEILKVDFANGQAVAKGDVLYHLDAIKYNAVVKNAEAKVAEARAHRDYAKVTAERYAELIKTHAVSHDDLDRACSARDTSVATLAAAEADLMAAKDDLAHCTIVAPVSGRIGTTSYTEGNYMTKGGAVMATLVQTDPIRVRFRISSVDYRDCFDADRTRIVREGVPVVRLVSGDATVTTGRVEYIENVVDRDSDTVGVYALLDNPDERFLDGQVVMVEFGNRAGRLFPAVPQTAVVQDTLGPFVWVVDGAGKVEKRRIVRGAVVDGRQLAHKGLAEGERVVADGVHRVRAGMKIAQGDD